MWAVTMPGTGELVWAQVPDPVAAADEVVVEVAAAGVNRADLLQAEGHYPPPPGASDILGMECSGTVVALGDGVTDWTVGDQVCALLAGGGYAELVAAPAAQLLPIPPGVDLIHAAGLPEAACTVWSNLVMVAGLRAGQVLLVHGGTSGIGTMAIQVGVALGATVAVTASRAAGLAACARLGATIGINYAEDDFVDRIREATDGHGADVILDIVGGKYLDRNVQALAERGRLVVIGMQGGRRAELDLAALMGKRASVAGTTLRSRGPDGPGSKAEIVGAVRDHLWPLIATDRVRPVIDTILDIREAGEAHRRLRAGGNLGKIVLAVQPSEVWPTNDAAGSALADRPEENS